MGINTIRFSAGGRPFFEWTRRGSIAARGLGNFSPARAFFLYLKSRTLAAKRIATVKIDRPLGVQAPFTQNENNPPAECNLNLKPRWNVANCNGQLATHSASGAPCRSVGANSYVL